MKKIIILFILILLVLLFLSQIGYHTKNVYGDNYGSASFVLSGKYYVDCNSDDVIKKEKPTFPYNKIKNTEYSINAEQLNESQKKQFYKYKITNVNFNYLYSISAYGDFVSDDVYFSKITLDSERFIIFAFNSENEPVSISINPEYDFEKNKPTTRIQVRSATLSNLSG